MTRHIDFIFDFGSPNAYLAHRVIGDIAARAGATLAYIPCLLGGIFKATGNKPPMLQFGGIKGKMEYEGLEMQRFIKRHGLTRFRMNPHFPVNTLLLMRGAVAADMDGRLADYIEAGCVAMWETGEKMDDPQVFTRVLDAAGFDGARLLARTQDEDVKARLVANTEAAVERGVFGIPTFFVGDEMFFGKNTLREVEELLG